jgi:hypothetical protein
MSINHLAGKNSFQEKLPKLGRQAGWLLPFGAVLGVVGYLASPAGRTATAFLNMLFAADSVQTMWYITRASGIVAYLLLWLSTVWGLAVSSKFLDLLLHRSFTYDFHQYISLLAIGFTFLHIGVLLFDRYLPYTLAQILVPFLSPYRPVWIGIGVIGFYLALLVTVTFYIRARIGQKVFRTIHLLSLVSYLTVTVHSLLSGSDSSLVSVMVLYTATFLVALFLIIYYVVGLVQSFKRKLRLPDWCASNNSSRYRFMTRLAAEERLHEFHSGSLCIDQISILQSTDLTSNPACSKHKPCGANWIDNGFLYRYHYLHSPKPVKKGTEDKLESL